MTTVKTIGRLSLAAAACLIAGSAFAYPAQSTADLNVRTGPGTQYQAIGVIPRGSVVDVQECSGNWCAISTQGGRGIAYASARYLREVRGSVERVIPAEPFYEERVVRRAPPAYGRGDAFFDDDYYAPRGRPVLPHGGRYGYYDHGYRPGPSVSLGIGVGRGRVHRDDYYDGWSYRGGGIGLGFGW